MAPRGIHAIASAQIAARSMHDFLRKTRTDVVVRKRWLPAEYSMYPSWDQVRRENPPVIESDRRAASLEIIEENFPEAEARRMCDALLANPLIEDFDVELG